MQLRLTIEQRDRLLRRAYRLHLSGLIKDDRGRRFRAVSRRLQWLVAGVANERDRQAMIRAAIARHVDCKTDYREWVDELRNCGEWAQHGIRLRPDQQRRRNEKLTAMYPRMAKLLPFVAKVAAAGE